MAPIGRVLFAAIFIVASFGPLLVAGESEYAAQPRCAVRERPSCRCPASSRWSAALSVLLGFRAKLGAWLLVLFLVPVTLMMHKFWQQTDPMTAQLQQAMFMKNVLDAGRSAPHHVLRARVP